jgi:hypothetical protein
MVKQISFLKHSFYKNDDANGGAMAEAIKNASSSDVILHSQTQKHGRAWGSMNPQNLLKIIHKNNGLYEVLSKFPLKMYFDIDKKKGSETIDDFLNLCKSQILEVFQNAVMSISGSESDEKISFHIVLNNYTINNEIEFQNAKILVQKLHNKNESFDWKVYTKNRNMKIINQSKLDGRIQSIIEDDKPENHLISSFFSNDIFVFPSLPEEEILKLKIEKSKKLFDFGSLPKMILKEPDNVDFTNPIEILNILPISSNFNHDYTHLIARFCFYNSITFNTFYSWIKNKKDDSEYYNKWIYHWNHLSKFPPVDIDRIKKIINHFYPTLKIDKFFLEFKKAFDFKTDNIKKIDRIEPEHFLIDEKFIVFNVGMGGGKTAQTITYLNDKSSYLWISPNIALATNTSNRIGDAIKLYTDYSIKEKNDGVFNKIDKLIICQNSLHYVKKTFPIVIIDEIETLLLKFQGEFIDKNGNKKNSWINFLNIIKNAEKVILLDAFITTKTLNFIKNFNSDIVIYERPEEITPRTVIFIKSMKQQILKILEDLKAGKKLFIFYPPKRASKRAISMADLYEMLKEEGGASGVFYNADVDEEIKKGLENVNQTWKSEQLVITNTCITCGVNYDLEDFDAVYLFITKYSSPRDVIQVSYRPRTIKDNKIYCCFLKSGIVQQSWHNDKLHMECSIYNKLYDDCLTEFKSPLINTFHFFCEKAGYKQEFDEVDKISNKIEKAYKKMKDKYNFGFDYDKIEDIKNNEVDLLQNKIFDKTATFADKMRLKKYFFNVNFKRNSDKSILASIWNKQDMPIFEKIDKLIEPTHFLNLLKDLNGWESILPLTDFNFEKIKINNDIKKSIFENMTFKWIHEKTKNLKLMKSVINEFWGVEIIKTQTDESENVKYSYNGDNLFKIITYYNFAINSYKNMGEIHYLSQISSV